MCSKFPPSVLSRRQEATNHSCRTPQMAHGCYFMLYLLVFYYVGPISVLALYISFCAYFFLKPALLCLTYLFENTVGCSWLTDSRSPNSDGPLAHRKSFARGVRNEPKLKPSFTVQVCGKEKLKTQHVSAKSSQQAYVTIYWTNFCHCIRWPTVIFGLSNRRSYVVSFVSSMKAREFSS